MANQDHLIEESSERKTMGSTQTTICEPDDTPAAPEPQPSGRRLSKAVIGVLIAISLVFALVLVGSLTLVKNGGSNRIAGASIPIPADAPPSDLFISLESVGRSGDAEAAVLLERDMANPIDGTVVHIADATSVFGTSAIYGWDSMSVFDENDGAQRVSCIGVMSAVGSSSSCFFPEDSIYFEGEAPFNVSWGSTSIEDEPESYELMIWDAATGGVWMSVETETGTRIVSDIASGIGFIEYEAEHGKPVLVELVDADHEVIWYNNIG